MKIEDIKTINDIKTIKEQSDKEIKHLEEEFKELEQAYNEKLLSKEEYNRELATIDRFKQAEEEKIKEIIKLENAYNNVMTNLIALHNLNDISPRDEKERREIEEERNAREAEINKYSELLTPTLNDSIKEEITEMFKEKEILDEVKKSASVKSESLSENQIATLEREAAALMAEIRIIKDRLEATYVKEDLEELKSQLKEKAEALDNISSILTTPFAEEIRKLYREETLDEKEKLNKDGLSPEALNDTERLEREIETLKDKQRDLEKQRKDSIIRFKKIYNEERINQEQNGPFDLETQDKNFAYYMSLKEEEDKKLKETTKELKKVHNRIRKLEKEQKNIRNYSLEANSLEISYVEYMKIVQTLEKNRHKLLTKLYEKKGLGNVIHKRGGRTKEERKLLMEARNEIFREIIKYQEKAKELHSIEEIVNILIDDDLDMVVRTEKPAPIKISPQQKETLEDNIGIIINGDVYVSGDANITINNGQLDPQVKNVVEATSNVPEATIVEEPKEEDKQENLRPVVKEKPKEKKPEKPKELRPVIKDEPKVTEPETQKESTEDDYVDTINNLTGDAKNPKKPKEPEKPKDKSDEDKNVEIISTIPKNIEEPARKTPDKNKESVENKGKRGIREIIKDIRQDYEIGRKDGQRYARSNLNVTQIFLNEMHSGNYQYNIIHVIPGLVKAGASLIAKLSGKLMTSKKVKDLMTNMRENVDALSSEDLEVLWEEFRGNFITQERYPKALVMVIQEKMQQYALGKVEAINIEITNAYRQVFAGKTMVEALDKKINSKKTSKEEKQQLLAQKEKILKAVVDNINLIRDKKVVANQILSGGLHGMDEDIRAAESKMNYVGYRFAKDYDLDVELEDRLTEYEKEENKARELGDHEGVMEAFLHQELLLEENTEVSNSFFGKRTTGKKQHSPLADALNYSQDPFIRDLFTTIAFTTAAIGAINALNVHRAAQEQVARVDAANSQFGQNVHAKGQELVDNSPIFRKGMEAQTNEDVLTVSNTLEREALDKSALESGSWMGGSYNQFDAESHKFFESFNDTTQQTLTGISHRIANGSITESQALQEMVQLQQSTQSTLNDVVNHCLEVLKQYRQVKPQFDLDAPEQTMQFLVNHSNSINDMNEAMLNSVQIGEELLGESAMMVGQLPNDLLTTLAACAGSALLAYRVSSTMSAKYGDNKYHKNAVTDMFEDYMEEEKELEQSSEEVLDDGFKEDSFKEKKEKNKHETNKILTREELQKLIEEHSPEETEEKEGKRRR